ncbi:MAG: immunoglobulin-like domain-containing protein, partial [Clostridium sp.]|uniref:immunoglobulin-like domain-containing protein n=1 Tax=Clostridium sp. TaxID=1506 RepID=UPI003EE75E8E
MKKRKLLGMIIALGLTLNLSTGLAANAVENLEDKPQIEEEQREEEQKEEEHEITVEEVVKLTYNNSTQKVGEKLDLSLLDVKAINVNDDSIKYRIEYGEYEDTENPIGNALNEEGVLIKSGVYKIVIQALNDEKECLAEGIATITIVEEEKEVNQAPVITGNGAIIQQYEKFDVNTLGIKAIDKEDGDLTEKIVIDSKVDTSKAGVQSVYVSVKDSVGNETKEVFSVVVKEKGRPIITGIKGDRLVLKVGDKFNNSMLEVKAVDKEDGDLTNKVEYEGTVDTSKSGIYAVTAKVSDKD